MRLGVEGGKDHDSIVCASRDLHNVQTWATLHLAPLDALLMGSCVTANLRPFLANVSRLQLLRREKSGVHVRVADQSCDPLLTTPTTLPSHYARRVGSY